MFPQSKLPRRTSLDISFPDRVKNSGGGGLKDILKEKGVTQAYRQPQKFDILAATRPPATLQVN